MVVKIFTAPTNYTISRWYEKEPNEYVIAVDKGAVYAMEHRVVIDLALGDFDSVTETEQNAVEKYAKAIKIHPAEKDETDTYLAIREALMLQPEKIIVYGGIGERFDHTYANMLLMKLADVTFITDTTMATVFAPGTYTIENPFNNASFFALETVHKLTLKGFRYAVNDYTLAVDDPLCISNEGSGTLQFLEGLMLVILTEDE